MAECEWAILCDYAFQDIGRKTCLIGTFDRIFTVGVPAVHQHFAVVSKLIGEHQEHLKVRLTIVRPTGETLGEVAGEGQLSDAGTGEIIMNLAQLPLPDFGIYHINVNVNDELKKTIGFTVTRPPQGPPGSQANP